MVRALRWSGLSFLGFLIVTQQVMTNGPLINIDTKISETKRHNFGHLIDFLLRKIDNLGLRWLTATVLIIAAVLISRQFKSWRPLNLAILALLSLNLVLLLLIVERDVPLREPRLPLAVLQQQEPDLGRCSMSIDKAFGV